jgi:hypothetical protein
MYLPILGKPHWIFSMCNGKVEHCSFPSFRSKGNLKPFKSKKEKKKLRLEEYIFF